MIERGKKGFIEIEQLSKPSGKGMGRRRATAYSGSPKKPTGLLGFKDFRAGGSGSKAMAFLRKLIN